MSARSTTPVIKLESLTKRYGIGDAEQTVLDGVNLTIRKGEFIAIMGPSGCGKTTLLNILGLLDTPDDGTYKLNGKSTAQLSSGKAAAIRSEKIGFIFQSFNLVSRLTVVDNVALPLTYTGCPRIKSLQRASEILGTFHLNEREYYMPHQLSGGQTQRVAIARALVNKPSIILADEPTGNLDSKSSHIIMEELAAIHKRGNTIIMVTHNPAMTTYADRVITMLDGKIDTDTDEMKKRAVIDAAQGNEPTTKPAATHTAHHDETPAAAEEKPVKKAQADDAEESVASDQPHTSAAKTKATDEAPVSSTNTNTTPADEKPANSTDDKPAKPAPADRHASKKPEARAKVSSSRQHTITADKKPHKKPLGSLRRDTHNPNRKASLAKKRNLKVEES